MSELESKHYLMNGSETLPDAREALEWAAETRVSMVDLKFCDLLGTWQHMTLPLRAFGAESFEDGLGFDGSSIRGWQGISESDMLLMPDPTSAILDPATEAPTLSLVCEIVDPITKEGYSRDPRQVAKRAEEYLRSTGIADTCFVGPECEFFVFDEVCYDLGPNGAHYSVDSGEGFWNSGKPGLGYTIRAKEGYFPTAPHDSLHDLRTRDGADARAARHSVRVPSPRGRVRRPVRDRPPLPEPDAHGRSGHDLQVRGQERGARARQVGDVHAEADLRRQRLGDALPPVPLEGGHAADGGQLRLCGPVGARALRTSADCSRTRRRCSRSARRRRTPTAGSCPATRRR